MGSALNTLFKSSAWLSRHDTRDELCAASEMMLKALSQTAPARFRFILRYPRFFFPVLRVRWHRRAIMAAVLQKPVDDHRYPYQGRSFPAADLGVAFVCAGHRARQAQAELVAGPGF